MKEEPEIIKILREEERLGKLQSTVHNTVIQEQKYEKNSQEDLSADSFMELPHQPPLTGNTNNAIHEKLYKAIFEKFPEMAILFDTQGTIVNLSSHIKNWLGYQPSDMIGKNLFTLPIFSSQEKTNIKKHCTKTTTHQELAPYEIILITKNGTQRVGLVHTSFIKDKHQEINANLLVITDITDWKKIEAEMKIKNSAISSSLNAIMLADLDGNLFYINKSFLKMWGYEKEEEVIGKPMLMFWKTKGKYVEVIDTLFNKGEWIGELTGMRKDHTAFQVQLSTNLIKDDSKKPLCMMGSFVDITKYNHMVNALGASEKKFRAVLDNSLDMIYQLNLQTQTYDYISPSALSVFGYDHEEITSFGFEKIRTLIHPDDLDRYIGYITKVSTYTEPRERIQAVEYRFKHKLMDIVG